MGAKNDPGEPLKEAILQDDPDIIDLVDVVSDPGPNPSLNNDDDPEYILFSKRQVDESLNRELTRLFSEKLQGIVVETIEKTLKKEVDRIFPLLKQNLSDQKK